MICLIAWNDDDPKSDAFMRFAKFPNAESAKKYSTGYAQQMLPEGKYQQWRLILDPMPREFFEEVLADLGDLTGVTGLEDDMTGRMFLDRDGWDDFIE